MDGFRGEMTEIREIKERLAGLEERFERYHDYYEEIFVLLKEYADKNFDILLGPPPRGKRAKR